MEQKIMRGRIGRKNKAFTVILGNDGQKYYVHTTDTTIDLPDQEAEVTFRIQARGPGLDPLAYDVQPYSPFQVAEEMERQISAQITLHIQDLDKRESEIISREALLDKKNEELQQKENSVEAIVAEKVAERMAARKLELDKVEAQLKSYVKKIEDADAVSKQRQQEIEGERKQLANAQIKFQEEGGESFMKIFAEFTEEERKDISTAADTALPKGFHVGANQFFKAQGISTEESICTQFILSALSAALTGQFVVLSGPTGVGKTSMVNMFASALGAGYGAVPVRPSWIDPTDLLGFYNPQLSRYQPSPFMDRFLDAEKYSKANRMYFLTLDEMNLSRVENYAADFLSRLEKSRTGESDSSISLYSREIQNQLAMDAKKSRDTNEKDIFSLASIHAHLSKYPSSIKIPDGLVLFGTVNLDDTAQNLSPKFLDRSFIINVPSQNLPVQITQIGIAKSEIPNYVNVSLNSIRNIVGRQESLSLEVQEIWNDLLKWQDSYIKPLGIHLGFRFSQTYLAYMRIAQILEIPSRTAASTFFKSKLFPWISFHRDDRAHDDKNKTKLDVLTTWSKDASLANYPVGYNLQEPIQKILEKSANAVIVQYLE